jgi:hypothetical protein
MQNYSNIPFIRANEVFSFFLMVDQGKWVHFSEVDKKELGKRKMNWKVVTCKECEARHAASADGYPINSIIGATMIQAAIDCGMCRF